MNNTTILGPPVSLKKQKPSKKAAAPEKPVAKSPKEPKPETAAKEAEEKDDVLEMDDSDDSEGEDNENVKTLAAEIDSGDEAPVDKTLSFKPGQDVGKIPPITKELAKAAKKATGEPGVLYIGRIPHGFYEHEMRQYLSQDVLTLHTHSLWTSILAPNVQMSKCPRASPSKFLSNNRRARTANGTAYMSDGPAQVYVSLFKK